MRYDGRVAKPAGVASSRHCAEVCAVVRGFATAFPPARSPEALRAAAADCGGSLSALGRAIKDAVYSWASTKGIAGQRVGRFESSSGTRYKGGYWLVGLGQRISR